MHKILILIILFSTNVVIAQETEKQLRVKAYVAYFKKDYHTADIIFSELIKNYPKSMFVDQYYLDLYKTLIVQTNNIYKDTITNKNNKHEAGTIRVTIGGEYTREVEIYLDRRISLSESYIKNYPNGELIDHFKEELLLNLAPKKFKERQLSLAKTLLNSSYGKTKIFARYFLGFHAHYLGNYKEAQKYFDELISITENQDDKATYTLYSAECDFQLNDIQRALIKIDSVKQIEEKKPDKILWTVAQKWEQYIKEDKSKSEMLTRLFLIIEE